MAETVSDTSPLQYLFQCDLIDLLPTLFGSVTIPTAVASEISQGRARGFPLPAIETLSWARLKTPRETALLGLATDLGPGEREALALALEAPGTLALLDDRLARRYAAHLGIPHIGTLGVLLRANRAGLIASVAPVLDQLERLRFRMDSATRTAVLRLSGELLAGDDAQTRITD